MDSSKKPFFSVITPSFNQGKYLAACLDSVRQQGDAEYEHIILDNCSTDETGLVLERYADDMQLQVIVERDHGQSEALNKGFRLAQGEIICWLNSDDAYCPKTFTTLRQAFADPSVHVVFGDVHQISYDGQSSQSLRARFNNRFDFIRWWSSRVRLHQPAIFFRRSVVETIGLLREDLHYAMDYEYWWRMAIEHHFHYIPEELAIQYRQPDSKTMTAWDKVLQEREKIFSPYYTLLNETESVLHKERREALAHHYLLQAYVVVKKNRSAAWNFLKAAWNESPRNVLRFSSLGLFRQLILS